MPGVPIILSMSVHSNLPNPDLQDPGTSLDRAPWEKRLPVCTRTFHSHLHVPVCRSMASKKRNRTCISLETKLKIIDDISKGQSQRHALEIFGIPKSMVADVWKQHDKITSFYLQYISWIRAGAGPILPRLRRFECTSRHASTTFHLSG